MDIIKQIGNTIYFTPPVPIQNTNGNNISPTTWPQYVASLHPWERRRLQDVTTDISSLIPNILSTDQQWNLVSDGSYSDNIAAYSWILHDGQETLLSSIGMAPGNPASAFRVELLSLIHI